MLVIQDPTNEKSTYLLESLVDSFRTANRIAGAFAFASAAGVRLIAADESFQRVARDHSVDLVVGIDAVTNLRAIDSLHALTERYPNCSIRAFQNPKPEGLFHPKFCWTKSATGGSLVVGSGNLTEGGLLGHWEAYSLEQLSLEQIGTVENQWDEWTDKHSAHLLTLDRQEVRDQAALNNVLAREGDLPIVGAPQQVEPAREADETQKTELAIQNAVVLIAEIPRSGDRWKQANFDLDNYENFFGANPEGENRLVMFRHVNGDGTLDDYERSRPPVAVVSQNYRFELAAAGGLPYPTNGRPIGVFIRVAARTFFYRLLLPGDTQYALVDALLTRLAGPAHNPNRMRRVRTTVAQLRLDWPSSPFWEIPLAV